jgi:hypothetical protein
MNLKEKIDKTIRILQAMSLEQNVIAAPGGLNEKIVDFDITFNTEKTKGFDLSNEIAIDTSGCYRPWRHAIDFAPFANCFFKCRSGGFKLYRLQEINLNYLAEKGTLLVFNPYFSRTLEEVFESMECSFDLKTWQPCGMIEAQNDPIH